MYILQDQHDLTMLPINDGCLAAAIIKKNGFGKYAIFFPIEIKGQGDAIYGSSNDQPFIYDEYEDFSAWNANIGYVLLRKGKKWDIIRLTISQHNIYSGRLCAEDLTKEEALKYALNDCCKLMSKIMIKDSFTNGMLISNDKTL